MSASTFSVLVQFVVSFHRFPDLRKIGETITIIFIFSKFCRWHNIQTRIRRIGVTIALQEARIGERDFRRRRYPDVESTAVRRKKTMLLALLYCEPDRIAAAALACDQLPIGDKYWNQIHAGEIQGGSIFETAYVEVNDRRLRERLLQIGIESNIDGQQLAEEVAAIGSTEPASGRAA
jgi:hypothetical protein